VKFDAEVIMNIPTHYVMEYCVSVINEPLLIDR
jgi:hypothetical protein